MPLEVRRKGTGAFVATPPVFFQALHDDPVEVAAQRTAQRSRVGAAERRDRTDGAGIRTRSARRPRGRLWCSSERAYSRARPRRLLLPDDALYLLVTCAAQPLLIAR